MPAEGRAFPNLTTGAVVAVVAAMPFVLPSVTLAMEVLVFAAGALSVVLLLGSVGLLSFGQGLYFGLGAYISGLVLRDVGLPAFLAVPLAVFATAAVAIPIGWLIVRRRGVYFVMLTFAFAQTGFFAMHALGHITGGENGLGDVPRPTFSDDLQIDALASYGMLAVLFLVAFLVVQRVIASPFGSVLAAIRINEDRAEALGYNVRRYKLVAFALAAAVAAIAGTMNTLFLGFVPPSAIELEISERLLVMGLIGGVGSPGGALIGAGAYMLLADTLGELWARWQILVALVLIVIVLAVPGGLVGGIDALRRRIGGGVR